jgi:hypothetical protein
MLLNYALQSEIREEIKTFYLLLNNDQMKAKAFYWEGVLSIDYSDTERFKMITGN